MQPAALISVLVNDNVACVRVAGRANVSNSVDFKCLIHELAAQKPRRFVLDLSKCLLMDSTFLGVLAGLRQTLQNGNSSDHGCTLELFNPTERVLDMLENLGLMDFFQVTDDRGVDEDSLHAIDHDPVNPNQNEISKTCLDAHKKLMEINPNNVPKFKDVTRFLEEDLKKQKSQNE